MDFVRSMRLMLGAAVFGVASTLVGGNPSPFTQRWKRCSLFVLYLLLGACVMPGVVHASPAGCAGIDWALNDWQPCNEFYNGIQYSCYAQLDPNVSYLTDIMMVGVDGNGNRSVSEALTFVCSGDPVQNTGNGGLATGGLGGPGDGPNVGDPINAATGNKYLQEDDYLGTPWLTFRRFYNSNSGVAATQMGAQWSHSFNRSLMPFGNPATTLLMSRPDGTQETFTKVNGLWTTTLANVDTLTETDNAQGVATGYTVFIGATRQTETYNAIGQLLTVTDETGQGVTLTYSTTSTPASVAPAIRLLLTVTDQNNRQLSFTYNSAGYVSQVTLPDNGTLNYTYDTNGNLLAVEYPDGKTRTYVYNESGLTSGANLPNALTGIVDENNVRYASTTYSGSGLATSSSFAGGTETTQLTYNSNGTATMLYPLGHSATMGFVLVNGLYRVGSIDQPCGPDCAQPWKTRTYDTNGYPASYTDFNNNLTTTQYNAYGLLGQQIDASGSANQRTTTTTWNTTLGVPLQRTVANASGTTVTETSWVYNASGQPLARCEIDPSQASSYACVATGTAPAGVRRRTYTYCAAVDGAQCPLVGLLLSVSGPRTDLTQTTAYSYYMASSATSCGTPGGACYQAGDLYQVTDALGHVTTYTSYDGAGRVTRLTDPNGVNTDMTYTPRGWLASRTVGGSTTTFTYMPYGEVNTVTDPDGVVTTFGYDTAHRLTDITDAQGNDIHYTLDAAGNKTAEQTSTASGTVVRSVSRTFNTLGQLTALVDGLKNTVFNAGYSDSYDAKGNLTHTADGLGTQQKFSFDALNRLNNTIDNYNGTDTATANTETVVAQDALNRVVGVTDPSNLNTVLTYDGLSNRTELQSPDSGTSTDTFDAAGNRLTHTNAKGVVSTSTYDALNRLTSTSYTDTTLNVTYDYDDANAVTGCTSSWPFGRLTRVIENSVTTMFCYNSRGKVLQKTQVTGSQTDTTTYTYTAADRLSQLSTPDGTVITYAFNANGLPSSVSVTPSGSTSASTVVSAVTYLPFGPINSYTLGNGQTVTRTYDANYRATDITSPAFNLHLARDLMGNVSAIGAAPGANPATESYAYDPLHRLSALTEANGTTLESYTYNQTGDRTSKTASGLATGAYLYTTGTHQLASIGNAARANDANGNTTASVIGGNTYGFGYNGRNRLTIAQLNGQTVGTYLYNATGQRISKVAATTERYSYDETNNLVGEYGTTNRDYIWVGDLPVAVIDNVINGSVNTSTMNYITADQLNTPRAVTNSAGTVIWSWAYQGNPFGEQQPTSTTSYVLNLRYPGQYYDAETATNYNLFRNYEPAIGRYQESDPIGLAGGISTYLYAGGNSLYNSDSSGQCPWCVGAAIGAIAGGIAGYETGGWEGALIGGAVGGAVGAVAPWAAATVGDLAAEATGSILAGQIATATSFSGINAAGAVAGTVATNAAEDQPLSQDVGSAAAIGAVAAIPEGAFIASVGTEVTVGSALVSTFTGATGAALTASTLPIQPGQLPVPPAITPACQ